MSQIVVGISDCRVSADPAASIVTYALGSCIAVMLYEPVQKVGGMLHYMLPESSLGQNKAAANPYMFADTGIPRLWEQVRAFGASPKRMQVRLAGGAQVLDPQNVFAIGKRNYLAAKKALWKLGLFIESEAVGGDQSRTVRLDLATGKSWLRERGQTECELGALRTVALRAGVPRARLGIAGLPVASGSGLSVEAEYEAASINR